MLKLLLPLSVFLGVSMTVAGCQSVTTFDRMKPEEKHALIRSMGQDCKAFGFKPGTTAFSQCIQNAIVARDSNITRRQAAAQISASQPFLCQGYADPWGCF